MSWESTSNHFRGATPAETSARDWFSRALDDARRASRLTVKETARRIGRTPKATERILAGDNAPQLDAVIAACREFESVWQEVAVRCGRANTEGEAEALLAEITAKLRERRG